MFIAFAPPSSDDFSSGIPLALLLVVGFIGVREEECRDRVVCTFLLSKYVIS